MSDNPLPVTVHIMDKEFRIACPEDEQEALIASARYLDRKMKEIRDSGKVVGLDRIAVMAALNIAHELLNQHSRGEDYARSMSHRIRSLQDKIEAALAKNKQLQF